MVVARIFPSQRQAVLPSGCGQPQATLVHEVVCRSSRRRQALLSVVSSLDFVRGLARSPLAIFAVAGSTRQQSCFVHVHPVEAPASCPCILLTWRRAFQGFENAVIRRPSLKKPQPPSSAQDCAAARRNNIVRAVGGRRAYDNERELIAPFSQQQ